MQSQIEKLKAQIAGTLGELQVYIEDESGAQTMVSNHTVVKLFAGYYVDEITSQSDRKGAIVTKNYKLKLSNTKATDLELMARLVGDRIKPAYASGTSAVLGVAPGLTADPNYANDAYYTGEGRYDLVPVQYQNIDQTTRNTYDYFKYPAPYQSPQLRGQFIYARHRNIANDRDLYSLTPPDTTYATPTVPASWIKGMGVDDYEYGPSYDITGVSIVDTGINANEARYFNFSTVDPTIGNGINPYAKTTSTNDFIWAGSHTSGIPDKTSLGTGAPNTITNAEYDNGLLLHIDHPILSGQTNPHTPLSILEANLISMSKNAPRRANMIDGDLQNPYKFAYWKISSGSSAPANDEYKPLKMSFNAEDQYLLGGKSCGAYLFLSPIEKSSLTVDADNKFGKKTISQGTANAISIDLIFQYRMTDYYGVANTTTVTSASANNTGRVGGIVSTSLTNLTYSKKVGFDILKGENDLFSFDVEVYAKYKPEGSSVTNITKDMLDNYRVPNPSGRRRYVDSMDDLSTPGEITSLM
jgi:hypothetical protein